MIAKRSDGTHLADERGLPSRKSWLPKSQPRERSKHRIVTSPVKYADKHASGSSYGQVFGSVSIDPLGRESGAQFTSSPLRFDSLLSLIIITQLLLRIEDLGVQRFQSCAAEQSHYQLVQYIDCKPI